MTPEAAWAAGETDVALEAIRGLWRTHRHPVLAALLDALEVPTDPLPGKTQRERTVALRKAWRSTSIAEVPTRIRDLFSIGPDEARRVFRRTVDWLDDPRVVTGLLTGLEQLPSGFASATALGFWGDVLRFLDAAHDPRVPGRLSEIRALHGRTSTVGSLLHEWRRTTPERRPAPPELDRWQAWLDTLQQGADTADALITRIYETPDDDGLRAVLGDLLLEQADPRGEAIAREMAGKSAASLGKTHATDWLGGIAPLVGRATFRLGFADSVVLRPGDLLGLQNRPEWRTVRSVHLSGRSDAAGLLQRMPLLREVLGAPSLHGLPRTLESLDVRLDGRALVDLLRSEEWPNLRRLSVTPAYIGSLPHTLQGRVADQLETLDIRSEDPVWFAAALDWDGAFTFTQHGRGTWVRSLERDANGRPTTLVLQAPGARDGTVLGSMRAALQGIDGGRIRRVRIALPTRVSPDPMQWDIAGELLARLCPAATLDPPS